MAKPMTDYLAEAKACAGSVDTKLATMYALVAIATELHAMNEKLDLLREAR